MMSLPAGLIKNSYHTGGTVSGRNYTGGLVGMLNGSLENSYAAATVSAAAYSNIGGLAGGVGAAGSVTNCYATGSVTGSTNVGRLIGSDSKADGASQTNCGVFKTSGGNPSGDIGNYPEALVDNRADGVNQFYSMTYGVYQESSPGEGDQWDFGNVWVIRNGIEYPTLYWQHHVWLGTGGGNNWSTAANWSKGTVPGANDIVVFNADGNGHDSHIEGSVFAGTVDCVFIGSGYTNANAITQAADLTIDYDYYQAGGAFSEGASINIAGMFSVTGTATFVSGANTVTVEGASAKYIVDGVGNVTWSTDSTLKIISDVTGQTLPSGETYYNIELGRVSGTGTTVYNIGSTVNGNWTIDANTTVNMTADVTVAGESKNNGHKRHIGNSGL